MFLAALIIIAIGIVKSVKSNESDEVSTPEVRTITVTETVAVPVPAEQNFESIGVFKTTGYCPCRSCSEGYGRSTASGAVATEGITIAVDPKVIPYGTKVWINGHCYIAQDCGGAVKGKVIDIFVDNHSDCDRMNGKYEVYIEKTNT